MSYEEILEKIEGLSIVDRSDLFVLARTKHIPHLLTLVKLRRLELVEGINEGYAPVAGVYEALCHCKAQESMVA